MATDLTAPLAALFFTMSTQQLTQEAMAHPSLHARRPTAYWDDREEPAQQDVIL